MSLFISTMFTAFSYGPNGSKHLTVCRSLMRCLSSARLFVTRVRSYDWISHNFAIRFDGAEVHVRKDKLSPSVFLAHACRHVSI